MKIFIDSADIDEIKQACEWGIIDGATTNPSLIKKAVDKRGGKVTMEEYIREILKVVPGPVSLEVIAVRSDEMVKQAKLLYEKFSPYGEVVIKIPVNPSLGDDGLDFDGLKAIRRISKEGIPVNCTLVMTPEQAILAAKAGATYVSPFAGRIDDYIRTKMGMKIGVDFKKGDYFDHGLLCRIRELKLNEFLMKFNSVAEAYRSSNVKDILDGSQDNGVTSGVDLVAKIVKIFRNYGYKTQVIASSIRNARQVREVAEAGADIATLPFNVIKEMVKHYKTLEGMRNFMADVVPQYEEIFKSQ
ncbi:transaldolase [Candidatus Bathyarchaeota archaeon]|nr:transaldolase [Candidatus Bathyarchaeota archaeon]